MTKHIDTEEYLEALYHLYERHELHRGALEQHNPEYDEEVLRRLEQEGMILLQGEQIEFTPAGFQAAQGMVRRHRLAERLLSDVLHLNGKEVEEGACEYEHLASEEITDSICTLLGHPRTCSHGSPIPRGSCCETADKDQNEEVVSLMEVPVGTETRVAFVKAPTDSQQHRLAYFGILPGEYVKLHQIRPAVIVVHNGFSLAMDSAMARHIYVWRNWEQPAVAPQRPKGRPFSFLWRSWN
jgi:DtxR family Mn-dependent transcriptional regulator